MKSFLLSLLLASVALAQTRSFYTDRPDIFGSDLSLGAGGSASAPTRTANTTKWFTFNLPTYAAGTGRGSLAMIRASDDGTDRSLYLGTTTNGLTDFRIYGCTYAGSPALYFLISPSGTVNTYSTTAIGGLLRPDADGTRDLGSSSFSWKDLWADGNLNLGASGNISFQGRSIIESSADGVISLRTAASGNMTRVLFGTANSSGPALSFSGTTIQATDGLGGLVPFSANTIELGHASDTTIARSAAGVVTIEGLTVLDYSGTPTTGQIPVFTNGVWNVMTPGSSGIGGSTGSVDNRVLRADGTGGSTIQNSAVFIDDFTSSTANNVALRVDDGTTANISAVITPKGTGAFIVGPKPDGTATGGNARGQYAVDFQMTHFNATSVAVGNYSLAQGYHVIPGNYSIAVGSSLTGAPNWAATFGTGNGSSDYSLVAGQNVSGSGGYVLCAGFTTVASGSASFAAGNSGQATGANSSVLGREGLADKHGQFAVSGGQFAARGDSQTFLITARNSTASTTPTVLFLDGSSARITIPNNTAWTFSALLTGTASAGAATYSYRFDGHIVNAAGTTTMPAASTPTVIFESNAAADASVAANNTNDSLDFTVTAPSSTAVRWSVSLTVNQVGF